MLKHTVYGVFLVLTCTSAESAVTLRSPSDFPKEAVAFFEREIVNVDAAVKKKDRTALQPVLTRLYEFLNGWGYSGRSSEEFQTYETIRQEHQDCIHAIDNIVVLGLDQLNPNLSSENRTSRKGLLILLEHCREDAQAQQAAQVLTPPTTTDMSR